MVAFPKLAVLASIAALAAAAPAAAQKSARHPVGDTLHFTLGSKVIVDMDAGAAGPMNAVTSSDLQLAVHFGQGDTISVWVEAAKGSMTSPMGEQALDVSSMLNKPTILTLSADGVFKTIKAADLMPDDDTGISSIIPDNESFGLGYKHPAGALRKGMVWTDTTEKKAKPDAPQKMSSNTITTHTVVGDSVVAGRPVIVIEGVSTGDVNLDMSIAGGQMTMQSKSKTTSKTRTFYSPDLQIILMSTTSGTGDGTQTIEGPMSMTMTTKQKLETNMKLIK